MPELKCTVQTCLHNKDFYCDLDKIIVDGREAKQATETCCESFEERCGDCCSNVRGEVSPTSSIHCEALECLYNDAKACHAGKISVEGSRACRCEQTECATFECGCK